MSSDLVEEVIAREYNLDDILAANVFSRDNIMPDSSTWSLQESIDSLIPNQGVTRLAFSEEETRFRDYLMRNYIQGLTLDTSYKKTNVSNVAVKVDEIGNTYLYFSFGNPDKPAIYTGSHLDSVTNGGPLDGALGVITALWSANSLNYSFLNGGKHFNSDLVVLALRAEEGSRYISALNGSKALFGELDPFIYNRKDLDDITFAEAVQSIGGNPEFIRDGKQLLDPNSVKHFVEVHIAQSDILRPSEDEKFQIGIANNIYGDLRFIAEFNGENSHSGAQPQHLRKNAAEMAINFGYRVMEYIKSQNSEIVFNPVLKSDYKNINTTPDYAFIGFDIRGPDIRVLKDISHKALRMVQATGKEYGITNYNFKVKNLSPAVDQLDPELIQYAQETCQDLGLTHTIIPSGASHDLVSFHNAGVPSSLIMIDNYNGSHNRYEKTLNEDIFNAANFHANFLHTLLTK